MYRSVSFEYKTIHCMLEQPMFIFTGIFLVREKQICLKNFIYATYLLMAAAINLEITIPTIDLN